MAPSSACAWAPNPQSSLAALLLQKINQDKTFANRPNFQMADNLFYGYNTTALLSSYGPHFIKLRKVYTLELLTAKRLQELQHVRQDSVRGLLQKLHEASAGGTQAIHLVDLFGEMSSQMGSRLLQPKTLREGGGDSLPKLMRELEHEMVPTLGDFIPWLKFLDFLQLRRMRDIHARIDKVLESMLSVLLSKEVTTTNEESSTGLQHITEEEQLTTEEIKAAMLDILAPAIHTTALTLEWAMVELLRNPRCLRKLRGEIDALAAAMGGELVRDEHLPELPYLENTVKEVFRLHPAVPLLAPRISSIEAKVDKYTLPPHTLVMVNTWAIGRDPQVWENAEQFRPERFEGQDMDVKGKHFDLLPFGAGRRSCPGLRLGLSVVLVTLANLVQAFDWELPPGQSPMPIDVSEKRGITSSKATPLLAIPKLRHTNAIDGTHQCH